MSTKTSIEWTDATWNPVTGCAVVTPGCTNCYAMRLAGTRLAHHPSRAGLTRDSKAGPVWTGEVRLNEAWLAQPLRWRRPRNIFVCAHGDLFAEAVPDEWIDKVFAAMALARQHSFQVLTKRAARMREYLTRFRPSPREDGFVTRDGVWSNDSAPGAPIFAPDRWPLPNVWLGVSVEDQARADERIPDLLATPAAVRFVSAEPLLGAIDFEAISLGQGNRTCRSLSLASWGHPAGTMIDWIIVGGESGPGARPMHPQWARDIRDQCEAAGVPFFFKQWGEWAVERPHGGGTLGDDLRADRVRHVCANRENDGHFRRGDIHMRRVGKKAAGRLLDGREHNDMPGDAT